MACLLVKENNNVDGCGEGGAAKAALLDVDGVRHAPPTHKRSFFLTLPEIHSDWSRNPSHGSQGDGSANRIVVLTVRKMSYEVIRACQ